jgi:phage-related protein
MEWIETSGIPTIEMLVEKFRTFSDWFRDNQDYIVAGLAAFATVILVSIVPALMGWAAAQWLVLGPLLATVLPVIAVGLAIAALAVGIVWLWKNWDKVWAAIKKVTGQVVDWVKEKISAGWNAVKGFFSGLKDAAVEKFTSMKTAVVEKAKSLVEDVKSWIGGLPQKIKDLGSKFLDAGKEVGKKILTGLKNGITGTLGFVTDIVSSLKTALKNGINIAIIDKVNTGLRGAADLFNAIPLVPDITAPQIPRLFKGSARFAGGLAMVGEMGREMVALPQGSSVIPNRDTENMVRGGRGDTTVNLSVQTNANPSDIARELAWTLKTSGR